MIFRYPGKCIPALCLSLLAGSALAQEPTPAPAQPPAQQTTAASQNGKKPAEPDYPDPRGLSIEAFYWLTVSGAGPDVSAGKDSFNYSAIYGLGKPKPGPGLDVRFPITRTGELRFEGFLVKGTGNQKAPQDSTIFGTTFSKGDYLSNQYQISSFKLYLDDLLYPHKFPVSKLRFKSLWAFRYMRAKSTIDAPLSSSTDVTTATSNRQIVLPEFGVAMEYAISPHILFRVDGSGFGLPHKSYVWDGNAIVSYRHGQWSVEGGYKAVGFKTSPTKDYYVYDLLYGGFVGIRYNWK